jgi:membrane-associated protein
MESPLDTIIQWFRQIYDVEALLQYLAGMGHMTAYLLLGAIIFTETGLMFGFFLPGDSLLFTAGLACAPENALLHDQPLNIWILNAVLIPAAIIGDSVGYWIGYKAGQALYKREKTFFFRKEHLMATKAFYEKHGGKTIILARFVPMIRTFAPVVAGIGQMNYAHFLFYNVFGGIGWIISLSVAGYFLGQVPWVSKNLTATLMLIIFVSLLPAIIAFIQHKVSGQAPPSKGDSPSEQSTS